MISNSVKLRSRQHFLHCCALLILAVFAVFWPLAKAGFLNFDDNDYVTENSHVVSGLTWAGVKWAFTTGHASNWHPLTWLSHMLDCSVFGVKAGPMHMVNVLFHAVNAALLCLLLWRMTGMAGRSFIVAALFAFHPLHVESVAWISERKDVLSTLFWLLASWHYVTYATRGRRSSYGFTLLFFALGLMSKPMLVTLPAVFLLMDFWPLRRFSRETIRRLVVEKLPFFCLSAASSFATSFVQDKAVIRFDALPLPSRIENALVSYVGYIWKTLNPSELVIFYPHRIHFPVYEIILCAGALVFVTLVAWMLRRTAPYFLFGWLWYVGTLVPVIGIMQVGSQAMADRYSYVPLTGLFIAATWGIGDFFQRRHISPRIGAMGAALLICLFAGITRVQIRYWKDTRSLFEHALVSTNGNLVAHVNLGAALLEDGKYKEALSHFISATRIDPYNPRAHYNTGVAMEDLGRTDDAIQHYLVALMIDPTHAKSLRALGDILAKRGKIPEALHYYENLLRLNPTDVDVQLIVGNTLAGEGNLDAGVKHLREAVRLASSNFDANYNLANVLAMRGDTQEAIFFYKKAMELKPGVAMTYYQLGLVLWSAGRDAESARQMRAALALSPNAALALDKLAWILSTSGDASVRNGKEAIQLAGRACELTARKNPLTLATLSAAYAEDGQFGRAISEGEQCAALSKAANNSKLLDLAEHLVKTYKAGKPYRETR